MFLFLPLQIGDYASALQSQTSGIQSTVNTILSWVTGIMGLVCLVQLILVLTSDGEGATKVKRVGTWLFLVVACAVGFAITTSLFS
ncbi:hypothetical protein AS202_20170 (plasmid) [Myroides odoratimimus]|uniref:Uncharacterized protein n=2 Tax=Flavobacteriaceae TaxID=49546 RepID=A0AAI8C9A3_9FLAO|nr:hypothetical protein AS202_19805 [Myroides odoratimimus]ALU28497.1 hypothetical protein AS202_20170 [Myroides odoratimimus]